MKKDSGFGAQGVEMKLRGWGSGCGSGFKVYSNSFLGVYARQNCVNGNSSGYR